MSYVFIDKQALINRCGARLRWAEDDKKRATEELVESFRHVWWRKLLKLPLLSVEEAKKRARKDYEGSIFGGRLGSIDFAYTCRTSLPARLIEACNVATKDEVMLSVDDASAVDSWEGK